MLLLGTLYVVLEFVPHDNLRKFLRKSRKKTTGVQTNKSAVSDLAPDQLLKFATGVAKAMKHIANCGVSGPLSSKCNLFIILKTPHVT